MGFDIIEINLVYYAGFLFLLGNMKYAFINSVGSVTLGYTS